MTQAVPTTLGFETKQLTRNAVVYLLPSLLVSGVSVLLTPVYARALAPDDLAVVAVANSVTAVLGILLGLSLYGCIPRLSVEYDEKRRRSLFGTLLIVSVIFPAILVGMGFILGQAGYLDVFENIRFDPHLKLVLLTSLAGVYRPLVVTVYIAREEPAKVAILSVLSAVAQLALTVLFVVGLNEGAVGVLKANLLSGAITGVASIVLLARLSDFHLGLPGLAVALTFSLPLVPHLVANWALGISDRLILDRYVPAADLGRYSLAYLFNALVGLVAASVVSALTPMANRQLKDPSTAANVPRLGTYALLIIITSALTVALMAKEALALIAPPSYAAAITIVPWVVLGAVFQALYFIWAIGTWYSMRTTLVPFATGLAAIVNIGLNLLLIPRYGVIAAALSTAAAYAVLAALHGVLAQKLYPIPWEYRRWTWMVVVAIVWYVIGSSFAPQDLTLAILSKAVLAGVAYPASLVISGFFTRAELARARAFVGRWTPVR